MKNWEVGKFYVKKSTIKLERLEFESSKLSDIEYSKLSIFPSWKFQLHLSSSRMSEVQIRSLSFVTLNENKIEKVHFLISSVSFVIVKILHSCIYITVSIYGLYKVNGLLNVKMFQKSFILIVFRIIWLVIFDHRLILVPIWWDHFWYPTTITSIIWIIPT